MATYVNKVEKGNCAIYRVNGHTLELNTKWKKGSQKSLLSIGQLRGYANSNPPSELKHIVHEKVKLFNVELLEAKPEDLDEIGFYETHDDLPF